MRRSGPFDWLSWTVIGHRSSHTLSLILVTGVLCVLIRVTNRGGTERTYPDMSQLTFGNLNCVWPLCTHFLWTCWWSSELFILWLLVLYHHIVVSIRLCLAKSSIDSVRQVMIQICDATERQLARYASAVILHNYLTDDRQMSKYDAIESPPVLTENAVCN